MRVTRQIVLGVGADEIDEDVVRGGTMTTHRKLKRARFLYTMSRNCTGSTRLLLRP